MKYLITESKLKTFIKDKFGIDFTGDVELDPSLHSLLHDFDVCVSYDSLHRRLNMDNYGPMYLITIDDNFKILYQKNYITGMDWIISNRCDVYEESDFMDLLGIPALGITVEQLLDLYI
jgi:hypothetical protein